jgi:thiol-disulfide isomerase/thioredoxin
MNIKLKLLAVVILLGGAAGAIGFAVSHLAPSDAPPQDGVMAGFQRRPAPAPLPAVEFLDEAGNATDLSRFKGKLTLVNLWATWCQPCIKEMPSLDRLKAAREGDRFTIATVSEDVKGAAAVEPFLAKNSLGGLPRYLDPKNALLRAFGAAGLPTTLLLDGAGREIGRLEGPADWDGPEAMGLIDWYIAHPG